MELLPLFGLLRKDTFYISSSRKRWPFSNLHKDLPVAAQTLALGGHCFMSLWIVSDNTMPCSSSRYHTETSECWWSKEPQGCLLQPGHVTFAHSGGCGTSLGLWSLLWTEQDSLPVFNAVFFALYQETKTEAYAFGGRMSTPLHNILNVEFTCCEVKAWNTFLLLSKFALLTKAVWISCNSNF